MLENTKSINGATSTYWFYYNMGKLFCFDIFGSKLNDNSLSADWKALASSWLIKLNGNEGLDFKIKEHFRDSMGSV